MAESAASGSGAMRLGAGDTARLSGAQAIAKAFLQCGVSWIGVATSVSLDGLAAPLRDNCALLDELGVEFIEDADPAAIAALSEVSTHLVLRGGLAWDADGGTERAAASLAAALVHGLAGGVVIVLAERDGDDVAGHALSAAVRFQLPLIDPRQEPAKLAQAVEQGFRLSEACRGPVLLRLRVGADTNGEMACADNRAPEISLRRPAAEAGRRVRALAERRAGPLQARLAAIRAFITAEALNETIPGRVGEVGLIAPGALVGAAMRSLGDLGLAKRGAPDLPVLVLNAVLPLDTQRLIRFCSGKRAVLVLDDDAPGQLEDAINAALRRADNNATFVVGKDVFPADLPYSDRVVLRGVGEFLRVAMPEGVDLARVGEVLERIGAASAAGEAAIPAIADHRGVCAECPALPVYDALELATQRVGPIALRAGAECREALLRSGRAAAALAAGPIDAAGRALARLGGTPVVRIETESGARRSGFDAHGTGVLVLIRGGCAARCATSGDDARFGAWLRAQGIAQARAADAGDRFELLDALLGALDECSGEPRVILADAQLAVRQLARGLRERIDVAFPAVLAERLAARAARLAGYQDEEYAALFLDRLRAVMAVEREAGGDARGYPLLDETSRLLARWMGYEDDRRLAQIGTRFPRLAVACAAPGGSRRDEPRFAREQALIERWLGALKRLGFAALDLDLALEIARSAELADGREASHARGIEALRGILDTVIEGGGAELADVHRLREAIRASRLRAQGLDPQPTAAAPARAASVQPLVFMKREKQPPPGAGSAAPR